MRRSLLGPRGVRRRRRNGLRLRGGFSVGARVGLANTDTREIVAESKWTKHVLVLRGRIRAFDAHLERFVIRNENAPVLVAEIVFTRWNKGTVCFLKQVVHPCSHYLQRVNRIRIVNKLRRGHASAKREPEHCHAGEFRHHCFRHPAKNPYTISGHLESVHFLRREWRKLIRSRNRCTVQKKNGLTELVLNELRRVKTSMVFELGDDFEIHIPANGGGSPHSLNDA